MVLGSIRLRSRTGMVGSPAPLLAETLARAGSKAARFYVRFGITNAMLRNGVS